MKTSLSVAPLVVALFACGCASSPWEKTESVPGGRLYVPKVYAPLLPGSIYPDKRAPVPARARPSLVVVCPEKGNCRKHEILEHAALRGFVVLVMSDRAPVAEKIDLLRTRAEADAGRIGWLLVSPTGEFLRRWTDAGAPGGPVAILDPAPGTGPSPSSPSKNLLFVALNSAEPHAAGDGTVLKLYSPNARGLLPAEAFRDAVEWLASETGAR